MPKISEYKRKILLIKKKKALKLYKQGFTLREVGKMVGYSYEWVRQAVIELST